jgi:hypothetical protein
MTLPFECTFLTYILKKTVEKLNIENLKRKIEEGKKIEENLKRKIEETKRKIERKFEVGPDLRPKASTRKTYR